MCHCVSNGEQQFTWKETHEIDSDCDDVGGDNNEGCYVAGNGDNKVDNDADPDAIQNEENDSQEVEGEVEGEGEGESESEGNGEGEGEGDSANGLVVVKDTGGMSANPRSNKRKRALRTYEKHLKGVYKMDNVDKEIAAKRSRADEFMDRRLAIRETEEVNIACYESKMKLALQIIEKLELSDERAMDMIENINLAYSFNF